MTRRPHNTFCARTRREFLALIGNPSGSYGGHHI